MATNSVKTLVSYLNLMNFLQDSFEGLNVFVGEMANIIQGEPDCVTDLQCFPERV